MTKYDTILFDLDGTLVDSSEGIMRSAQYALSRFGIEVAIVKDGFFGKLANGTRTC